jgi:DNA-binding transcriptional regulator YiaG
MSKLGKDIIKSLKDLNKHGPLVLMTATDIAALRKKLKLSQSEFAKTYRIHLETLRKWEQKTNHPDMTGQSYLFCISKAPDVIRKILGT